MNFSLSLLLIFFLFGNFSNSQTVGIQSFASGFNYPVEITHAGDDRLFVVEQGGKIKILNANGSVNASPFLSLTSSVISTGGERGLLGLAFHPNYNSNGYFFINYTNPTGNTVIARYSVNQTNPNIADVTSGNIIMTINQPFSNHNGGTIKFGSDGYLYIATGDGGGFGDPGNRAQNINDNLGKILRIDVNSTFPYSIPNNNPFLGIAGNDEIWSFGFRNPWKFSFNRQNGDMWISDVGEGSTEEINKIPAPLSNTGLNFGWRCYEGTTPFNTVGCAPFSSMVPPFSQYFHSQSGGCSVIGGYVYTGSNYPNFQNKYFFSDYCNNKIGFVNTSGSSGTIIWSESFPGNNFSTLGEDINGELYIAGIGSGNIYKIIDNSLKTENFSKNEILIFPNPAKNFINFSMSDDRKLSEIKVTDFNGKILLNYTFTDEKAKYFLNISNLKKGIYIISVSDKDNNKYHTKLIVD